MSAFGEIFSIFASVHRKHKLKHSFVDEFIKSIQQNPNFNYLDADPSHRQSHHSRRGWKWHKNGCHGWYVDLTFKKNSANYKKLRKVLESHFPNVEQTNISYISDHMAEQIVCSMLGVPFSAQKSHEPSFISKVFPKIKLMELRCILWGKVPVDTLYISDHALLSQSFEESILKTIAKLDPAKMFTLAFEDIQQIYAERGKLLDYKLDQEVTERSNRMTGL